MTARQSGVRARLEPVGDLDRLGRGVACARAAQRAVVLPAVGLDRVLAAPAPGEPAAARRDRDQRRRDRRAGRVRPGPAAALLLILTARALRLHESGEPALDSLYIEHNGLVAERAMPTPSGRRCSVCSPGAAPGTSWPWAVWSADTAELCHRGGARARLPGVVRQRRRAAHLDLAALRRSGRGLADAAEPQHTPPTHRARRLYAAIGPLALRAASTADEALAMLEQLKALHQRSWRRRGQPGCFATPFFETFHRDLIRDRFRHGEIQLLCAAAGDRAIGYLYNFAYGDRIYAYQSGFDYAADGRLKPGLVTHALAIEQAMREGYAIYDFMAGENRLKASFASHWRDIVWLRAARRRPLSGWNDAACRRRIAAAQASG